MTKDNTDGMGGKFKPDLNEACSCMDPRSPDAGCPVHKPGDIPSGKVGRKIPLCTCGSEQSEESKPHTHACLISQVMRTVGLASLESGNWRNVSPAMVKKELSWVKEQYGVRDSDPLSTLPDKPLPIEEAIPSKPMSTYSDPYLSDPHEGPLPTAEILDFMQWAGISPTLRDRFIDRVNQFREATKAIGDL